MTCLLLATAFSTVTYAQLEKHSKIIGGSVSMSYIAEPSMLFTYLGTFAEYFVIDNLAVGGGISGSYSTRLSSGSGSNYMISLYPEVRYYLPVDSELKPFGLAGVGVSHYGYNINNDGGMQTNNGLSAHAGLGLVYFLSRNIGAQGVLTYAHGFQSTQSNTLTFSVGLQIFIP